MCNIWSVSTLLSSKDLLLVKHNNRGEEINFLIQSRLAPFQLQNKKEALQSLVNVANVMEFSIKEMGLIINSIGAINY